jgi:hypothetical protein
MGFVSWCRFAELWCSSFRILKEQSAKGGIDLDIIDKLEGWMKEAGFVDVEVKTFKVRRLTLLCDAMILEQTTENAIQVPWGPWPKDRKMKEIGRAMFHNLMDAFDSYGLALLTRGAGYTENEANIFLALVKNAVQRKELHSYNKM